VTLRQALQVEVVEGGGIQVWEALPKAGFEERARPVGQFEGLAQALLGRHRGERTQVATPLFSALLPVSHAPSITDVAGMTSWS